MLTAIEGKRKRTPRTEYFERPDELKSTAGAQLLRNERIGSRLRSHLNVVVVVVVVSASRHTHSHVPTFNAFFYIVYVPTTATGTGAGGWADGRAAAPTLYLTCN